MSSKIKDICKEFLICYFDVLINVKFVFIFSNVIKFQILMNEVHILLMAEFMEFTLILFLLFSFTSSWQC